MRGKKNNFDNSYNSIMTHSSVFCWVFLLLKDFNNFYLLGTIFLSFSTVENCY